MGLDDSRVGWQEAPGRRPLLLIRPGGHGSDEDLDLGQGLRAELLADDRTHEPVDREGEYEVDDEGRREGGDERVARNDVLVEEVVEDVPEGPGEKRDRTHREHRREAAAASRRLAVASGPEPGEGEDERRDPESPERHDVDDDAADESQDRSGDRPTQESQRDDDHEQEVRRPARDEHRRDDHDLHERGDEDDEEGAQPDRAHGARSFGTRTMTASSDPKST